MKPRTLLAIALLLVLDCFGQISSGITYTSTTSYSIDIKNVALDDSGNSYFISNYRPSFTPDKILLSKCDPSGNMLWQKVISDSGYLLTGYGIDVGSNSIYVCGNASLQSGSGQYAFISRLSIDGSLLWERKVDSLQSATFGSICVTPNGCVVSGSAFTAGYDGGLLLKLDSMGNTLWSTFFFVPFPAMFGPGVAAVDESGNIYISSVIGTSTMIDQTSLHKFSPDGDQIWTRVYGSSLADFVFSRIIPTDTQLIVQGYYRTWFPEPPTLLVGLFDTSGFCNKMRIFGDTGCFYFGSSFSRTIFNTYVVTGYKGTFSNHHSFIMELDENFDFIRGLENPLWHDLTGFTMDDSAACGIVGWSQNGLYEYHRGNSDYSWQWGCGFQSLSDTNYSFYETPITDSLQTIPVAITTGISSISNVLIPETPCDNLASIPDPTIQSPTIYPNPTSNSCTIIFPAPFSQTTIFDITDVNGKMVRLAVMDVGMQTLELDFSDLPDGMYFLKSNDGFVAKIAVAR